MENRTGIIDQPLRDTDGRLRQLEGTLIEKPSDPVVPLHLINKYGLRSGVEVMVSVGKAKNGGRNGGGGRNNHRGGRGGKSQYKQELSNAARVSEILEIDGIPSDQWKPLAGLETYTTIDPQPMMKLEYEGCPPACRLIDLFCPIGFGQRGMIVSPPKAGKTTLLQQIAFAVQKNYPDVVVMAVLIDERPEEVTDFRRNVPCEVLASSNDHPPERHVGLAVVAIERAKRLAEEGKDVVVLLDSLTRVGRAFNTAPTVFSSGRTLSGGIDATALSIPKQLFGAARNTEECGSLTILASCLIDTGSRGDQVIFEEFKGTGNMELILNRDIANQRIYPAIDLAASGTRKEHLLQDEKTLETTTALRRRLLNMRPVEQVTQLLKALDHFKTNDELVGATPAGK